MFHSALKLKSPEIRPFQVKVLLIFILTLDELIRVH